MQIALKFASSLFSQRKDCPRSVYKEQEPMGKISIFEKWKASGFTTENYGKRRSH